MFSSEVKIITVASKDSCNHHHHLTPHYYPHRDIIQTTASTTNHKQQQNYKNNNNSNKIYQQQQQIQIRSTAKNQKNQSVINNSNSNSNCNNNGGILNGQNYNNDYHQNNYNNNRKKGNNSNSSYSQLNNRKKQQLQQQQLNYNNNNKTIKNQNICLNEYANTKTTATEISPKTGTTTINYNSNSKNTNSNNNCTNISSSTISDSSKNSSTNYNTSSNSIKNSFENNTNSSSNKIRKLKNSTRSNHQQSKSSYSSSSSFSSSSSSSLSSPPSSSPCNSNHHYHNNSHHKNYHLKTLECAVITLHNNLLDTPTACIVMNNSNNSTTTTTTIATTTATATITNNYDKQVTKTTSTETLESKVVETTSSTTVTTTPTVTASVAIRASKKQSTSTSPPTLPPSSYSIDFLYAVGAQLGNRSNRIYNPSTYLSTIRNGTATPATIVCDVMNHARQHPLTITTSANINSKVVNNGNGNSNINNNGNLPGVQQQNTRPTFKDYNFEIPPPTHPSIRPYCHFIYPPPFPPQGYHPHHPNNSIIPQYPPPLVTAIHAHQYHNTQGCNQIFPNRNLHAKKVWHWTSNNLKKGGNNNNNNKNGNNNNSLHRNRNHNNNNQNNLNSDKSNETKSRTRIVPNSRSPTPSPKSESPSLYKGQSDNMNCCNGNDWNNGNYNSNATTPNSIIADLTNSTNSTSSSIAETQNGNASSLNGYESDSSHSSYRYNDFDLNYGNLKPITSHNSYHHQMPPPTDVTSLINFPTYSTEENSLRTQAHYYGSQQNLTFWNNSNGINTTFGHSPHSGAVYSNSTANGTFITDITNQYVTDSTTGGSNSSNNSIGGHTITTKRNQSHNRLYRGRRQQMYQNSGGGNNGGYRNNNHHPHNQQQHHYNNNNNNHHYDSLPFTPADRFLTKAHLIETKKLPETLLNGSKWDQLSRGIWEKFVASQQRTQTFCKKMYLWRYLYMAIKDAFPRYGLYLVGSTISGFGADTSDVDMCLVCRNINTNADPRMEAMFNLNHIKDYLSTTGIFEQFNLIEAKVPILRFRDRINYLEVDLNFNNCVGIRNTHLLYCYSQLDWRLRPLVLITKLWAQFHNINNAKNMTISSYSLALMVIHFLQYACKPPVLPCLHTMFPEKFQIILKSNDFGFVDMNEEIDSYNSENTQTIGELFLQFLEYYSNFDYSQYAISVRTGKLLPIEICRQAKSIKNDIHQWKELCIEEPFDLTNTARSVYDYETFERVKAVFITSWKILQETLDLNSIFTPFIPVMMVMPSPSTSTIVTSPISTSLSASETSSLTTAITDSTSLTIKASKETQTIPISASVTNILQTTLSPGLDTTLSSSSSSSSSQLSNHGKSSNSNSNSNNNNNQVPLKITPSIS